MGPLGVEKYSYSPLLSAHLSSGLPRKNLAMFTGAYVLKFLKWAPIDGIEERVEEDGNAGLRAGPGQDPSP